VHVGFNAPGGDKHCANIKYAAAAFADSVDTYPVGAQPFGLAFDGRGLWVGNIGSQNLMKLDPRRGSVMLTVPVSGCPGRLAYDGTNIWTSTWCRWTSSANQATAGEAPLAAFQSADGHPVLRPGGAAPPTLNYAEGLASYGPKLFAQFNDGQKYLACMTSANPTQVAQSASAPGVESPGVGAKLPRQIIVDGEVVWSLSGSDHTNAFLLGTRRDCTPVRKFPLGVYAADSAPANALAADARYVWIGMWGEPGRDLLRVDKSSGAIQRVVTHGPVGALVHDGTRLWFTEVDASLGGMIRAIDPTSGNELAAIPVGGSRNALYDGRYLWVVSGADTVTRIYPHAPLLPPPVKAP
jgi:hypothetical protein